VQGFCLILAFFLAPIIPRMGFYGLKHKAFSIIQDTLSNNRSYALISSCVRFFGGDGIAGLSQILCKHRNAVQIEQNLFKAEVAQAAAALFSK
jgi:hypothetical protein